MKLHSGKSDLPAVDLCHDGAGLAIRLSALPCRRRQSENLYRHHDRGVLPVDQQPVSHLGLLNTWPAFVTAAVPSLLFMVMALVALRWVERH